DRVCGIFPSHVLVALGGPRLIFLEAISVEVAVAVDPFQAPLGYGLMLTKQPVISQPLPSLVQRDEVKRRGVCRTVIWRVWYQLSLSEFAYPDFMHDLAGLRVTVVVDLRGLQLA